MTPISNEEFKSVLAQYAANHGINHVQLAERLGRPRQTVDDWVKKGIRHDATRGKTAEAYAWLFASSETREGDGVVPIESVPAPEPEPKPKKAAKKKSPADIAGQLRIAIKTELARRDVASLSETLVWFLFQATGKERDQFRDDLGDEWKEFLSLTRAMTGETAFKITDTEGGLEKWKQ